MGSSYKGFFGLSLHGVLGGASYWSGVFFRSAESCRKDGFWGHNPRKNIDKMRAVSCWKAPINGVPSMLQTTVLKDFFSDCKSVVIDMSCFWFTFVRQGVAEKAS